MFDRFLEISVYAPEIRDSLAFYESLGFVQAPVGEAFNHPYAVVTDGRLFLGLHGQAIDSPALTFVMPQLMRGIEQLEELGRYLSGRAQRQITVGKVNTSSQRITAIDLTPASRARLADIYKEDYALLKDHYSPDA